MERERDYYFDNAKFILIVLVVLGHGLELVSGNYVSTLYNLIYLFHMPAFVLVTGYFTRGQARPKIGGLLLQYLLFQTLYLLFDRLVLGGGLPFTYATPYWILWFLISTITWKLITPLVARYPLAPVLAVAVLVAVLAGYDTSLTRYMSLSRSMVFFPFFLIGYHAGKAHFQALKRIPVVVPVLVFAISALVLHNHQLFPRFFLYATNPYESLRMDGWQAGFSRLACMVWGFVLVCSFFALVPAGRTAVSRLGQRTGQVFLLHGFLIRYLQHVLPLPLLLDTTLEKLLFTLLLTGISLLLLHRAVAVACAPLLDPIGFFRRLRAPFKQGVT